MAVMEPGEPRAKREKGRCTQGKDGKMGGRGGDAGRGSDGGMGGAGGEITINCAEEDMYLLSAVNSLESPGTMVSGEKRAARRPPRPTG